MNIITGGGAFTKKNIDAINDNFAEVLAGLTPGRLIYCYPASSNTLPQDGSIDRPYTDLPTAYSAGRSGKNDVVVLVGDGSTTGSARLTSTLTWAKNALHLVGVTAPSYNPRARIATLSGATAFANFVTVTATGCVFRNFALFNDNAIAAQKTWIEQGGRNYYEDIQFGGMGDGTSAHSTTSRIMELGGSGASGENVFRRCTFGLDTSLSPGRDVANATIEFVGNSKRNVFDDCLFICSAKATTVLHVKSSGTNPLETFQMFKNCIFHNPYPQSSASLMAAIATLAANGNGRLVMNACTRFGATDWGTDATSLAQIYVAGYVLGAGDDVGQSAAAIAT